MKKAKFDQLWLWNTEAITRMTLAAEDNFINVETPGSTGTDKQEWSLIKIW